MPISDPLTTLYASDEDIYVRATIDFANLLPDSQRLAAGTDGAIVGGSPWILTSATVNFGNQGVEAGMVVWLRKGTPSYPQNGQWLAVESVSGTSCTLRRAGMAANVGQPPSAAAGVTGIDFLIVSYNPQIEEETFQLNERYSINPAVSGRSPESVADLRVFRRACVLRVLLDRYTVLSQAGTGDYALKIDLLRAELSEIESRLQVRWALDASGVGSVTNFFTTRIAR